MCATVLKFLRHLAPLGDFVSRAREEEKETGYRAGLHFFVAFGGTYAGLLHSEGKTSRGYRWPFGPLRTSPELRCTGRRLSCRDKVFFTSSVVLLSFMCFMSGMQLRKVLLSFHSNCCAKALFLFSEERRNVFDSFHKEATSLFF